MGEQTFDKREEHDEHSTLPSIGKNLKLQSLIDSSLHDFREALANCTERLLIASNIDKDVVKDWVKEQIRNDHSKKDVHGSSSTIKEAYETIVDLHYSLRIATEALVVKMFDIPKDKAKSWADDNLSYEKLSDQEGLSNLNHGLDKLKLNLAMSMTALISKAGEIDSKQAMDWVVKNLVKRESLPLFGNSAFNVEASEEEIALIEKIKELHLSMIIGFRTIFALTNKVPESSILSGKEDDDDYPKLEQKITFGYNVDQRKRKEQENEYTLSRSR